MASYPIIHGFEEAPKGFSGARAVLSGPDGKSGDVPDNGVETWDVEVVTSLSGMERLETEWRRFEQVHAGDVHAFQSVDWCLAWGRTFLDKDQGVTPFVITVRRAGQLVLLWPLMRCRLGPLRALSWFSDPFSQYGDILTALKGASLAVAMERAFQAIRDHARVDIVRLRHVRDDARVAPFLERFFHRAAWQDGAPWMDLTRFSSVEVYERRYTKEQRRRRKRIRKSLEKTFGEKLEFGFVQAGEGIGENIERLVEEKRAWLTGKGLMSRPLASPRFVEFLSRLPVDGEREGLRMVISCMRAGEHRISWELGFRFKGRHYGYITAHERTLTRSSPMRLHMDLSQKQALCDGMHVFDLLVPVADHKKTWSSAIEPVREYFLPLTMAGRVLGESYLCHLRPLLRQAVERLPKGLRVKAGGWRPDMNLHL